jgi:hypothetical protein
MADHTSEGIFLKRTRREGAVISVEIQEISEDKGVVAAAYNSGTDFVGLLFDLARVRDSWKIISVRDGIIGN